MNILNLKVIMRWVFSVGATLVMIGVGASLAALLGVVACHLISKKG